MTTEVSSLSCLFFFSFFLPSVLNTFSFCIISEYFTVINLKVTNYKRWHFHLTLWQDHHDVGKHKCSSTLWISQLCGKGEQTEYSIFTELWLCFFYSFLAPTWNTSRSDILWSKFFILPPIWISTLTAESHILPYKGHWTTAKVTNYSNIRELCETMVTAKDASVKINNVECGFIKKKKDYVHTFITDTFLSPDSALSCWNYRC